MELIAAILLFAASSTVTPGPNNVMIMTSGLNFGIRRSLPHFLGICLGFPVMVLLVGLGFGVVFERFPIVHEVIRILGVAYLLFLAWKIANSSSQSMSSKEASPLTFLQAALFQWMNPKAWVMATGALAAFTTLSSDLLPQALLIAASFFLVAFPCVGIWMIFGVSLKQVLQNPVYLLWFNRTMAFLLVLSILPIIIEFVKPLL